MLRKSVKSECESSQKSHTNGEKASLGFTKNKSNDMNKSNDDRLVFKPVENISKSKGKEPEIINNNSEIYKTNYSSDNRLSSSEDKTKAETVSEKDQQANKSRQRLENHHGGKDISNQYY